MPVTINSPITTPRTPEPGTAAPSSSPAAAPTASTERTGQGDGIDGARRGAMPRTMPRAAPAPTEETPAAKAPSFFERLSAFVEDKLALGTKKLLQAQQACTVMYHQALEQLLGLSQFLTGLGAFISDSVVNKFRPTQPTHNERTPGAEG